MFTRCLLLLSVTMRIDMVITPCKTGVKEYFANLCKGFSKQQRKFEQLSKILKHLFHGHQF